MIKNNQNVLQDSIISSGTKIESAYERLKNYLMEKEKLK